jgi:hypothetical protein
MNPATPGPLGGEGKVVESDETVIGGKAKNRAYAKKEPKKHTVLTLVERDGKSRTFMSRISKPRRSAKRSSQRLAASRTL